VARLAGVIELLRMSHAHEQVDAWRGMASAGQFVDLADSLMQMHYDPRYDKHRERMAVPLVEVPVAALEEADLDGLAAEVAQAVTRITG
jgi:tRNA 2-selenouridine synthase